MASVKVHLKVQKRSGFDKSHHNALSQQVGKIVPVLMDEVIPNTKVHLRYAMAGSMPPLASDAYMKCYYDVRCFFVPMRLLYGGFESWFTNYPYRIVTSSGSGTNATSQVQATVPYFSIHQSADFADILGPGSLADYLGYKIDWNATASFDTSVEFGILPFLAYHRVCDDWFRQPNVTVSCFARPQGYSTYVHPAVDYFSSMLPFISVASGQDVLVIPSGSDKSYAPCLLADGVSVFDLRSCNYDYDYFTNALPSAQLGNPLTVATSGGSFTIASLRVANSLQQFAEINELAGSNLVDVVHSRYGANLSMGVAQKSVYLGGARIDIGTKAVEVSANTPITTYRNPFIGASGSTSGRVVCQGSDILIDGFTANEPGYILVVGCVVPKVTYGSGIRRYLTHYMGSGSLTDMANPLLQNVGNQPIYQYELNSSLGISAQQGLVFGYTDRYAEFMTMEDEVHAHLVLGESLDCMVAQRWWTGSDNPVIGTNFLTIQPSALNNITMVSSQIASYGWYGQFAFDYKVSQPLAQYSLPSLQNPAYEHGKSIIVHRGGFRF